jgi:hypothetical protein
VEAVSGFPGMDYSERIKPLMQQVALLDAKRMDEIRSLHQQLEGAVEALREVVEMADVSADFPNGIVRLRAIRGHAAGALARLGGS